MRTLSGKQLAGLLAAVMLAISLGLASLNSAPGQDDAVGFAVLEPGASALESSLQFKAVSLLSLADRSFTAEAALHLSWPEQLQQQLEATGRSVSELVDFANRIDNNDFRVIPFSSKPLRAADGYCSQNFEVSGAFHLGEQDYRRFPFIRLQLPLQLQRRVVEPADSRIRFGLRQGALKLPTASSSREVDGYLLKALRWKQPSTQLRDSVVTVATYVPGFWSAFCIYLIPWGAVFTLVMIAPWLDTDFDNSRLAVPTSALLALVFIQDGIHNALPALNYLTLIDKLYMFAYCCAVVEFLVFTLSQNYVNRNKQALDPQRKRNIARVDTAFQLSSIAGVVIILVLNAIQS